MKKKLKDLLDYEQPTKYIVETENYSDEYKLPVLTAGKSFVLGYTNETEGVFKGKNEPVIIFDDFTRDTKYVDFDFKVKSSAMKILHKHNKDDSLKYLHYALNNIKYVPFSHKRLWISDFSNMEIDYPSPDIQNTIATELDTIQSAIDTKKQQLSLLDEAVKSEFVEMFGENPVESGKWKVAKWADKVRITNGRDYKKLVVKTGLYPVYGSGGDMGIRVDDYLCSENTVIIGRKGNIDKPIFVKEKFWNVDTAFGLNVDESEINPYYFFEHSKKYNYRSMDTGVTIPSLTKTALFELKLAIPPLDLQNQFAAFVQQIDKSKFVVKQQIADLEELLDSKMQQYFA